MSLRDLLKRKSEGFVRNASASKRKRFGLRQEERKGGASVVVLPYYLLKESLQAHPLMTTLRLDASVVHNMMTRMLVDHDERGRPATPNPLLPTSKDSEMDSSEGRMVKFSMEALGHQPASSTTSPSAPPPAPPSSRSCAQCGSASLEDCTSRGTTVCWECGACAPLLSLTPFEDADTRDVVSAASHLVEQFAPVIGADASLVHEAKCIVQRFARRQKIGSSTVTAVVALMIAERPTIVRDAKVGNLLPDLTFRCETCGKAVFTRRDTKWHCRLGREKKEGRLRTC